MSDQRRMDPMALTGEEEPSGPIGFTIVIEEGEPKVYPVDGFRIPSGMEVFQCVWQIAGMIVMEGMGVDAVESDEDSGSGK